MPEPLTLAATAAALAAPYLKEGVEAAAGRLGQLGAEKVRDLVGLIRDRFRDDGDASGSSAMDQLESGASLDTWQAPLAERVEVQLERDTTFASALKALVGQIEDVSPQARTLIQRMSIDARNNQGVQNIAPGGTIDQRGARIAGRDYYENARGTE